MNTVLQIDHERLKRVATLAQKQVDAGHFCSAEWRVVHNRETVSAGQYGLADIESGRALPDSPMYRIYSMTKPIVSIAALQLIERGELYLPTPLSAFIPQFSEMKVACPHGGQDKSAKNPITVEHLLTHRSGLSYDFLIECNVAKLYRDQDLVNRVDLSLGEFTELLASMPMASEPGTTWRYSYSTDVLARVLEVASGKSLQELLQELVFAPCGMNDTGFALGDAQKTRLLTMYGQRSLSEEMWNIKGPQTLTPMPVDHGYPLQSNTFARGGHGLYSSADDYLKFMQLLVDGCTPAGERLLSAPMVEMMWCDRIPEHQQPMVIGENPLSGYGWNLFGRVLIDPGQAAFLSSEGEGGWAGAASTYFWVDRKTGLSGLSMTQYLGSGIPLGDIVRSAAYQALV